MAARDSAGIGGKDNERGKLLPKAHWNDLDHGENNPQALAINLRSFSTLDKYERDRLVGNKRRKLDVLPGYQYI